MIRLKPSFELEYPCPECGSRETNVARIIVPGIHWLADCTCGKCGLNFMQSLPVGHTLDFPVAVAKEGGKLYPDNLNMYWQSVPFQKFWENTSKDDVSIRKVVFKEYKQVIILNTLDYLYGHTLLKLYNSQHHLDTRSDLGLIVIIPKIFEWMIPQGCAEAWIVDLRLDELRHGHEAIARFVTAECERFDEIHISKAFSHPDFTTIDIARLTGVQPFDVDKFYDKKPFFTFVLREDRWWLKSWISDIFLRVANRLKLSKFAGNVLVRKQDALVRRTIKHIRRSIPEAEFSVTGLGKGGSLARWATDTRIRKVDAGVEKEWCRMYANSHVVIGAHGSNMLLPTAHAAGCVEVLMESRYRNLAQDISVRYNDRRQLFLYRFADQYASPKAVAEKAVAMYRNYHNCYDNMVRNIYR